MASRRPPPPPPSPSTDDRRRGQRRTTHQSSSLLETAERSGSSSSSGGGGGRRQAGGTFSGRPLLPPLPAQPSPPGRSSSPRNHSHSHSHSHASATASTPLSLFTASRSSNNTNANAASTPPRRRSSPPLPIDSLPIDIPNEWEHDTVAVDDPLLPAPSASISFDDDPFLSILVDNEFSSPSSYPLFTTNLSPIFQTETALDSHQASTLPQLPSLWNSSSTGLATAAAAPAAASISLPPLDANLNLNLNTNTNLSSGLFVSSSPLSSPSRRATAVATTRLPNVSSYIPSQSLFFDILNNDPFAETIHSASPSDAMPTTRNRTGQAAAPAPAPAPASAPAGGHNASSATKRRRTAHAAELRPASRQSAAAPAAPAASAATTVLDSDDDLFGDSPSGPGTASQEEYATIDLTEATEVPPELMKPEVDNRIKLSAFQCVICMDGATSLTVTHCGHMYCAQCLHSSIISGPTRGKCPMCRTKIDMKMRTSYNSKTKGHWPLELKLMTATRKGKRKADSMS